MRYVLTAEQMRRAEQRMLERGTSLRSLMERAGAAVAEEVSRTFPSGDVVIATGGGNNGGDGWVTARILREAGRAVRVLAVGDPEQMRAESVDAVLAARRAGVAWQHPSGAEELAEYLDGAALVVDALFGIGFRGTPRQPYAAAIEAIADADAPILAVDIPSGVESDTGNARGPFVAAAMTVTFSAMKPGLLLKPGRSAAGEIVIADIGIPEEVLIAEGDVEVFDLDDLRALLPWPEPEDHKGSRGRVLVVAGSASYAGAAVLAVSGALRMGAGYVRLLAPPPVVDVVHACLPSAIALPLPMATDGSLAQEAADEIVRAAATADAIAIGPGLTDSVAVGHVVRQVLARCPNPVVVDADALNVLAGDPAILLDRSAPTLVTPHAGELGRLLGLTSAEVAGDRLCYASRLAGDRLACLVKGPGTVVATRGRRAIVEAGNAGLAKAGSGDFLTGMLGTLVAQGLSPYEAGVLGTHLHARAADLGADELTETCFLPTDLPEYLPAAVADLR